MPKFVLEYQPEGAPRPISRVITDLQEVLQTAAILVKDVRWVNLYVQLTDTNLLLHRFNKALFPEWGTLRDLNQRIADVLFEAATLDRVGIDTTVVSHDFSRSKHWRLVCEKTGAEVMVTVTLTKDGQR